jgi:serine/threonine-protein kinase
MASIKTADLDHFLGRDVSTCRIINEIGRGSMAVVYKGFQKTLKRPVAIKILPKASMQNPQMKRRFQQEAETAAILNHPNIVQIYEIGETEDSIFVIIQLIQGHSLDNILKRAAKHVIPSKRILLFNETFRILCQLLDALGYAHEMEIIHRDIKPANIMIDEKSGRAFISDFGIAKDIRGENLDGGMILGTPLYVSPEQAAGKEIDGRADIYSLGCMLFEMTAGYLPLRDKSPRQFWKRKLEDRTGVFSKSPSEVNPQVDPKLEAIILKAIAFDPADRFPDCRTFNEEIELYSEKRTGAWP